MRPFIARNSPICVSTKVLWWLCGELSSINLVENTASLRETCWLTWKPLSEIGKNKYHGTESTNKRFRWIQIAILTSIVIRICNQSCHCPVLNKSTSLLLLLRPCWKTIISWTYPWWAYDLVACLKIERFCNFKHPSYIDVTREA